MVEHNALRAQQVLVALVKIDLKLLNFDESESLIFHWEEVVVVEPEG